MAGESQSISAAAVRKSPPKIETENNTDIQEPSCPPASPQSSSSSVKEINSSTLTRGNKPSHRNRQRTITVQSQISLDIANAFTEVRKMNIMDPMTEAMHKVQAIVASREKEWAAKTEKLTQRIAYEQRRNEPLEQKAAERMLLIGEYEEVVQKLIDFVKEIECRGGPKCVDVPTSGFRSANIPGPERPYSPDDVASLIRERDQLAEEVSSLETSYTELFKRYEKIRMASADFKKNNETLKKACEEVARRYAVLNDKFALLRERAEEELEKANEEIDRIHKEHESDTLALRLRVKQLESKNSTLETTVAAQKKELYEMTTLFNEVISKADANAESDG